MRQLLLKTSTAVEDCRKHLEETKASGTSIESYLVQHLLILLCAEMQQELYGIVEERATILNDEGFKKYVNSANRLILRSVQKDSIAKYVGYFGPELKEKLNSLLEERDVTIYNNAIRDRHVVAHKHGVQVTLGELQKSLDAACKVLDAVRQTLLH